MKIGTTLSISCTKERVAPDEMFDISGYLKRIDTGAGIGYKMVGLYKKEPGETDFSFYYETGTYPNGLYIFGYQRFTPVGVYEFYTRFEGDAEFEGCESDVLRIEVKVPVGIETALSISVDRERALVGEEVRISGRLVRIDTGAGVPFKEIRLYRKRPGATEFTWHGRTSTDSDGDYWFTPYLEWEGDYEFYTEFLGDEEYAGCEV